MSLSQIVGNRLTQLSTVLAVLSGLAVKILGPITSSLFMAFVPMVTAILAIPVLGELPAGMQWGGLTLCSVALLGHQLQWFKPNAPIRN